MEAVWDIQKIQDTLPQKYPFLFVDRVIAINEEEKSITCLKEVSINDYFFQGHFPGNPVMPGVIIIEALAQASILLYAALRPVEAGKKPDYFLGKVDAKFFSPVRVGDQLMLEVKAEKLLSKGGIVTAEAKVDGETVTSARIVFGVKPRE
ncbi:MAG: 3-hydroxyacyl-ACP dehydratase FabZ [Candidatus Omnitrophica bacterium]|nr:3-hydroxyacyl-ACP dehydratase FabZ [Candidatus Omnitrophota bacterium]